MKTPIQARLMILLIAGLAGLMSLSPSGKCLISGKVTDENGEGIPVANVQLKQNGNLVTGTTTDFDGNFCFSGLSKGTYDIAVNYIGYQPTTQAGIMLDDTAGITVSIKMKPSAQDLKTVTISCYKTNLSSAYMKSARASKRRMGALGTYTWGYAAHDIATAPAGPHYDLDDEPKPTADKKEEDKLSNTNDFDRIIENEFLQAANKPLSTFSIDVDVASYAMMRTQLEQNQMPEKNSIRLEEMINYFTYNYADAPADKPFSVATEVGECPWNNNHQLVHIGIQGRRVDKSAMPPANLVFLIDVSGSMQAPNKLPLMQQSLRMLVNELRPQDKIAMVVYAGSSGLVLPATPCNQKEKILQAIDNLQAGGSTNGAAGINQAYEVAKANFLKGGNNRVILCTDGDFNVGASSDADLTELIEKKREEGVFLSVLGFGMGNYKDAKMEKLADKGNGNYAYIDNLAEAEKNLVTQMGGTLLTIAKDVKIQVEFNPEKVKAYRLIGYENRALEDKDFNDDKKDAGEIGAGASVTALYEIITDANDVALKQLPKTDALKYQKTEPTTAMDGTNEMLTLKIRYKDPKGSTSRLLEFPVAEGSKVLPQCSDNFRFAASVAGFGMLLRNSKFKGNLTYNKVRELATSATGADTEGYRAAFIKLVDKAKGLPPLAAK